MWRKAVAWVASLVGLSAVLALVILRSEQLPSGPVEVIWDREACAHCRMHIGEPGFAAQLQLRDGTVLSYDDPGCLLEHLEQHAASEIHAMWFHHVAEDRWLSAGDVRFRSVQPTPMGYGLGAIEVSEPGTLDLEQAKAKIRADAASRRRH